MKANKLIIAICCGVLALIWGIIAAKTFNPKPDLNGDNINYYIYASSLATGHGYSDLSSPDIKPTSNFPPGYPLLMTPIRLVTDSVIAQKWLNEIFVLAGIILIFFTLYCDLAYDGISVLWQPQQVSSVRVCGISPR